MEVAIQKMNLSIIPLNITSLWKKLFLPAGVVDFFEGGAAAEAVREQEQWLNAIIHDTDPLVKPEQAFVVTQILEGIYKSAETGKEVFFD